MSDEPNRFLWFCFCLGAGSTNLEMLRSLGPHEQTFVELLDQAIVVIDSVYNGSYSQFLADLEAEINDTLEESSEIQLLARIKTWLDGRQLQFQTQV